MTDEEETGPNDELPIEMQADIDYGEYDSDEMEPPDWITDLDREILALLGNLQIILTPAVIAKNIDRSRSSVSRRLSTLEAGGLVEKPERGHYQISSEGYARMTREVPVEPPDGYEDKNWIAWKILTPEELDELEENGRISN
ncbi:helix-turn-helix domain-containing protein [Halorientalis pallida]|uniref:helix-turn-helix domain-containing protein n=1 Tax=Halorientalis pallida TaxID=2479928 RepID=UPI003C6ED5C4